MQTDYFLGDALGSTRQLTDATGQVSRTQSYDPFGNPTASSGEGSSIFGYAGEQTDATGLQFLRARYYDPGSGRFTSRDPFPGYLDLPQSQNPYAYGLNNPVLYTDPSGNFVFPWDRPSGGSAVGIGVNFSNAFVDKVLGLAGHPDEWPCIKWDQILSYLGAQAVALLVNVSVVWNVNSSYVKDYIRGAINQYLDDMTLGLASFMSGVNQNNIANPAYQAGRNLGHSLALIEAMIEIVGGLAIFAAASSTIGITIFGTLVGALPSGGTDLIPGVIAVTGEVGLAALGAAGVVHGGFIVLRSITDNGGGGGSSAWRPLASKDLPDSYVPPKGGPRKVVVQNGPLKGSYGWLDENGDIWVPSKSNGAHGGPHWDVQINGGKGGHINIFP